MMKNTQLMIIGLLCGTLCGAQPSRADLLGSWQFEEGAGTTAVNSAPAGPGKLPDGLITNDATGGLATGGSVWVNDPVFGSVISFNNSAFVTAGTLPLMDLTNDFTWSFLANSLESSNDVIVGNRYDGTGTSTDFSPRQFVKLTQRQFEFHMNGNGNDNLNYPDMLLDDWNHQAVVKDGPLLTYYRNGVEIGKQLITQPQTFQMPLFFGGTSSGELWTGYLDDVRVYDNALTPAEVAALVPSELTFASGDVNGDGDITLDDFEPIRANFLQNVTNRDEGDLNKDRFVDFDDYNEFKVAFLAAGGSLSAIQIPEPSSVLLLALLTCAGMVRRREQN